MKVCCEEYEVKILILRTFAHSQVWETTRSHCEFEQTQLKNMIYSWEPDLDKLKVSDCEYALGIYTHKYFSYRPMYSNSPLVFQNTDSEQIVSLLKLKSLGKKKRIVQVLDSGTIQIGFKFKAKLWDQPNTNMMFKLDSTLISIKKNELKAKYGEIPKTDYNPLAFVLKKKVVKNIFDDLGLQVDMK